MATLCADLHAECLELCGLLGELPDPPGWGLQTRFHGWTAWDEIAHLHLFDQMALEAIAGSGGFSRARTEIEHRLAHGQTVSAIARERFIHLPGAALGLHWQNGWESLVDRLAGLDPRSRLPWFGPDMSARSFATARLMETWAHGQDVWDAVHRTRPVTARLLHIAQLGVITFRWSFLNRGLAIPAMPPVVELEGPGGTVWRWGDDPTAGSLRGPALDFCLVVTQRRHFLDTALTLEGTVAGQWMSIAQCFAGPPAEGPPPGTFAR